MQSTLNVRLQPASYKYPDKKWQVTIEKSDNNTKRTIAFGQNGYTDYLISKDPVKKQHYLARHNNETDFWKQNDKTNIYTASYWSRYLLWEHPDIHQAIQDIEKHMGVTVKYSKNAVNKYLRQLIKLTKQ